jgi:hypothetical protein
MKFVSIITLLTASFAVSATRVSWDPLYDQGTEWLGSVACSDGTNGLLTKGYNDFDDLPTFPNIGGSSVVAAYNSPSCGLSHLTELDSTSSGGSSRDDRHLLEYYL